MAFRHKIIRCTAFGSCYGNAEEWSTGFYMGQDTADVVAPTQTAADRFLTEWQVFFTTSAVGISSNWKTEGVRVAALDPDDGKSIPGEVFYAYPTTPFSGTGSTSNLAPQLTLVASLQATPDRGLGAKGRMYLPGVVQPIGANGKIIATDATKVATGMQVLFNSLNASADIEGQVINASKGRNLGVFGDMPVNRYVTNVLVGDVYDTQRRRRNQLIESYVSKPITHV